MEQEQKYSCSGKVKMAEEVHLTTLGGGTHENISEKTKYCITARDFAVYIIK